MEWNYWKRKLFRNISCGGYLLKYAIDILGHYLGFYWWTGRPGVLQFMGSQRVGHDWVTELNWTQLRLLLFDLLALVSSCVVLCSVSFHTLQPQGLPGSFVHRISQARILEWFCHFLLQGIFPTQGSNPRLLHCWRILYHWATREAHILEWYISTLFSRKSELRLGLTIKYTPDFEYLV